MHEPTTSGSGRQHIMSAQKPDAGTAAAANAACQAAAASKAAGMKRKRTACVPACLCSTPLGKRPAGCLYPLQFSRWDNGRGWHITTCVCANPASLPHHSTPQHWLTHVRIGRGRCWGRPLLPGLSHSTPQRSTPQRSTPKHTTALANSRETRQGSLLGPPFPTRRIAQRSTA